MRLGFHYHTPAVQRQGQIFLPGYLGLFVDSLAAQCKQLVCFQHTPVGGEASQMDYQIRSENVRLVNIGPHNSVPARTMRGYLTRSAFREWVDRLDVLLVRAPTPLLPVFASVWKKPLALLLVSDALDGLDNLPQPKWRLQLIKAHGYWYQRQQDKAVYRSLTFVNSEHLYQKVEHLAPELIQTRTTTLSKDDFFYREDTCQQAPYRLLFTGRMTRIKGLIEIVRAVSQLVDKGLDVKFDLVGMTEKNDSILDDVASLAQDLGIAERITFYGYKPAGPELLAYYRDADIYVTASQASSEGFPRTIWEAMASSLPVIATEVGSIPAFVQNAAVIIPPKDAVALARAIEEMIHSPSLRRRCILEGLKLAQENTLEKRAEELVSAIDRWLGSDTRL